MEKRRIFTEDFNPLFSGLVRSFCGLKVGMFYKPSLSGEPSVIVRALKDLRSREILLGMSLAGLHRDAVEILSGERPFRGLASLGQARLTAVGLRMAQAVWLAKALGEEPVILLDDVTAELDGKNRERFRSFYAERFNGFQSLETRPSGTGGALPQGAAEIVLEGALA